MGKSNLFWRTDFSIRAPSLRVIDSEGKLVGVLGKDDAVRRAKEVGLTLVEIAPNATPPVAKIVDFGKFRYAEEKKARAQAKKVKGGDVKEIRFSPFIAENDFNVRIERIKEFFADKNKVRVVVVFKGPQMRVKHVGYDVIKKIKTVFGDTVITDMEPKFLGKHLVTVISPVSKTRVKVQDEVVESAEKIDLKK
ncbi:translation initiation factor IF-3 [Candidatus Woesebacteria bacterium RIFOXYD1_FULL_41_28]|uniref:Translation initiation factor IF-3 n=4 Tax=Candidatus Woeseibacteriota TaxID=1752722 RepID=A0A0G0R263_9BACT|nr:MAG: Translation initiation factor IF-3 [Candidatus Woesebacteria bacterium GW2011_GWB1_40_12]KKS15967.1 MAG: Translation initiation factor IF-3 [Candidatus Woesebacteria bacterium GW2011_GWA1_41_7]OGM81859.1 MAG: translation initiation factor IF-3 [Candidatus Woesebacteria bacterium RIFOXYB1_FULL_41_13]OGM87139.1 MAG: translation initiation factor IF-3 [Candidatus Woesebacteria bacterium RIFOXYD1_FULL_41_28]